jgi:hypothetical protein
MAKPSFKAMAMHAIRRAEKQLTPAYQNVLRQHAAQSYGWDNDAVESLNMRYKNNGHVVTYNNDTVLDLENGTPDVPPAPAIRSFMINQAGKY